MSQSVVVAEQVCRPQPFELSETACVCVCVRVFVSESISHRAVTVHSSDLQHRRAFLTV